MVNGVQSILVDGMMLMLVWCVDNCSQEHLDLLGISDTIEDYISGLIMCPVLAMSQAYFTVTIKTLAMRSVVGLIAIM